MVCVEGPVLFKVGQIVRWKKDIPLGYEGIFKGAMVCPKCGNADPDKFDEAE